MHNVYVNEIIIGFLFGIGFAFAFWLFNKLTK
jgi:type III secretory pathway component EscT